PAIGRQHNRFDGLELRHGIVGVYLHERHVKFALVPPVASATWNAIKSPAATENECVLSVKTPAADPAAIVNVTAELARFLRIVMTHAAAPLCADEVTTASRS